MDYYKYLSENEKHYATIYNYIVTNYMYIRKMGDREFKGRNIINYPIEMVDFEISMDDMIIFSFTLFEDNDLCCYIYDVELFNIDETKMKNKILAFLKYNKRKETLDGLL